jgi:recombination protein RecT
MNLLPSNMVESISKYPTLSALSVVGIQDIASQFLPILKPMFKDEKFAARFMQSAFQAINNPALANCEPISVFGAIMNCATIGLTLNPALGQAYIVSYNTKTKNFKGQDEWKNIAQLQVGYRGYADKLYNTGHVASVEAAVVRANDFFEFEKGTEGFIKHRPALDSSPITHSYAIVYLKGGAKVFEVLPKTKIEQLRLKNRQQTDKNGDTSPKGIWAEWYDRQAMKSALRQLIPYLPMSENLDLLLSTDDSIVFVAKDGQTESKQEAYDEAAKTQKDIEQEENSALWVVEIMSYFDRFIDFADMKKTAGLITGKYKEYNLDPANFTEKERETRNAFISLTDSDKQKFVEHATKRIRASQK